MWKARITTPWTGNGTQMDPYRPLLGDAYPLTTCCDLAGQAPVPEPNQFTVEVECTAEVLDQIEADSRFVVLSSEEVVDAETPQP